MKDIIKKGEDLFSTGRIAEAEQVFNSIIDRDFRSSEAHNNLGVIAFQKGEIDRAVDCFTRALQIDPDYKDALFNIAHLLRKLGKISELAPFLREMAKAHEFDGELLSLYKEAIGPISSADEEAMPEKENTLKLPNPSKPYQETPSVKNFIYCRLPQPAFPALRSFF